MEDNRIHQKVMALNYSDYRTAIYADRQEIKEACKKIRYALVNIPEENRNVINECLKTIESFSMDYSISQASEKMMQNIKVREEILK